MQSKGIKYQLKSDSSTIENLFVEGGRLQELTILAPELSFVAVNGISPYWAEFYGSDESLKFIVNNEEYDFSNRISFFSYNGAKRNSNSLIIFKNNQVILEQTVLKLNINNDTPYYYENNSIVFSDFLPKNCVEVLDTNLGAYLKQDNQNLICTIPDYTEEQYINFMSSITDDLKPKVYISIEPQTIDITSIFNQILKCFNPIKNSNKLSITIQDKEGKEFIMKGTFIIHPYFNNINSTKVSYVNHKTETLNLIIPDITDCYSNDALQINNTNKEEEDNGN